MKCLFVQLGRIGDLILLTPTFDVLKSEFGAHLTLLSGPSNYQIIANHKSIDDVIIFDKSPFKLPYILPKLLLKKFDIWIDPRVHISNEGRILASLSRSERKVGYNPTNMKTIFTDSLPEDIEQCHHVQIGLNSLIPLGYKMPEYIPKPSLPVNNKSEAKIENFTKHFNNFTLLNISASKDYKMWHDEFWSEFIKSHRNELEPLIICFTIQDKNRAEKINSSAGNTAKLFYSSDISDVVSLVNHAKLLITPDTSLVHIAAAFNKPVLALYSGLKEFYVKFKPLSDIAIAVRANQDDPSIKSISLERVAEAYHEISILLS